MALKVEHVAVADLVEYKRNARTHSEEQVDELCAFIMELGGGDPYQGFVRPVLIDENNELIAGHGRKQAAVKLQMEWVPAIRLVGLSEKQKRALRIADNQLALNAGWDLDLLSAEISDLEDLDFEVELLGFDDDFLKGLPGFGEEEKIEEEQEQEEEKNIASEKVIISVGPYEIKIPQEDWSVWETSVRGKVGMDIDDIKREIRKRLKI